MYIYRQDIHISVIPSCLIAPPLSPFRSQTVVGGRDDDQPRMKRSRSECGEWSWSVLAQSVASEAEAFPLKVWWVKLKRSHSECGEWSWSIAAQSVVNEAQTFPPRVSWVKLKRSSSECGEAETFSLKLEKLKRSRPDCGEDEAFPLKLWWSWSVPAQTVAKLKRSRSDRGEAEAFQLRLWWSWISHVLNLFISLLFIWPPVRNVQLCFQ